MSEAGQNIVENPDFAVNMPLHTTSFTYEGARKSPFMQLG